MENKYYTPSIEEFHVGFEYECILPQWSEQKWRSTIVGTNEDLDGINQIINLKRCRVKYLDEEDIKSFGFNKVEKIGLMSCGLFELDKLISEGRAIVFYFDKNKPYRLIFVPESSLIFIRKPLSDGKILFYGKIRNKLELERILEQVGVI